MTHVMRVVKDVNVIRLNVKALLSHLEYVLERCWQLLDQALNVQVIKHQCKQQQLVVYCMRLPRQKWMCFSDVTLV